MQRADCADACILTGSIVAMINEAWLRTNEKALPLDRNGLAYDGFCDRSFAGHFSGSMFESSWPHCPARTRRKLTSDIECHSGNEVALSCYPSPLQARAVERVPGDFCFFGEAGVWNGRDLFAFALSYGEVADPAS